MKYRAPARDLCFPRAADYPVPRPAGPAALREGRARVGPFGYSERHLQCVWFDPALRPAPLRTSAGEEVTVEDAGAWNLEAGPDFLGAALRIGPGRRRVSGDIEVHVHPADWVRHGHRADPRYARVIAHVTYHAAPLPARELPPGAVQIALEGALAAAPGFSFENLDVAAYPFAARAAVPPCRAALTALSPAARTALLRSAGEERLRRKAARLAEAMEATGEEQAVYEETLAALGYKHNKAAGRTLARRVPVDELRAAGGADAAYALLLGVAGLMPPEMDRAWDAETRRYVRALWDGWWKLREAYEPRLMPEGVWRRAGLRPANQPVRRLSAAALLFTRAEPLTTAWRAAAEHAPETAAARIADRLRMSSGTYWDRRLGWGAAPRPRPVALIGDERAQAILVNVAVPFLAAAGCAEPFFRGLLDRLPPEPVHAVVRQTASWLFGRDHSRRLYAGARERQGLIQIFHDYCLPDRSRCAACALPRLLAESARPGESACVPSA